jgi:hypothetical protein
MHSNTSNWLITFSDLFFILVSFFILRHQMIELPGLSFHQGKSIIPAISEPHVHSLYTETKVVKDENITIPIYHSWFSSPKELSSKGEEGILQTIHYLADERLSLRLHIHYPSSSHSVSSLEERTITLLHAFKKQGVIPKTLKISRHHTIEETYLGSIDLVIRDQN